MHALPAPDAPVVSPASLAPLPLATGSQQLRRAYRRDLGRGLGLAVLLHLVGLGACAVGETAAAPGTMGLYPTLIVCEFYLPEPPVVSYVAVPDPPGTMPPPRLWPADLAPEPLPRNPLPPYPARTPSLLRPPAVLLSVLVSPEGTVRKAALVDGAPQATAALARAALEAVWRWRFQPALRAGRPVEAWTLVPLPFEAR